MQYRSLLRSTAIALVPLILAAAVPLQQHAPRPRITVFKDPNCGCCKSWVEHLRKHGYDVATRDTTDVTPTKRTARVPEQLYSCHTAFVNGYVIEGHVPAADIDRLLKDKPRIAGIAVAGMPAGSPGMEMGGRVDHYDVMAFNRDGSTRVFARH